MPEEIDYSDLDERFTPYYLSGERVEVVWKKGYEDYTGYGNYSNGKKGRFYVGRSTGWKPVYLMLLKSDSIGGAAILSSAVKSIRGLGKYRHGMSRKPLIKVVSSSEIASNKNRSLNPKDYI